MYIFDKCYSLVSLPVYNFVVLIFLSTANDSFAFTDLEATLQYSLGSPVLR